MANHPNRSNRQRFSVLVLPYSLQPGEVGKPYAGHLSSMDGEISRHSTLKAAARSLSKAISCRTSRIAAWFIIADMDTGQDYSLRQAQGNVAKYSGPRYQANTRMFGRT